jgi:hypothetical protein
MTFTKLVPLQWSHHTEFCTWERSLVSLNNVEISTYRWREVVCVGEALSHTATQTSSSVTLFYDLICLWCQEYLFKERDIYIVKYEFEVSELVQTSCVISDNTGNDHIMSKWQYLNSNQLLLFLVQLLVSRSCHLLARYLNAKSTTAVTEFLDCGMIKFLSFPGPLLSSAMSFLKPPGQHTLWQNNVSEFCSEKVSVLPDIH